MQIPCPACEHTEASVEETIEVEELTRAYLTQLNVSIRPWFDAWPCDRIDRLKCAECGLGFFDPSIAGDSQFYSLLTELYEADRWDFSAALSLVRGGRVADLGCGPGNFLKRVDGADRLVGNDLNPDVVDDLMALGIEPVIGPIGEMKTRFEGEFDVVTAFHVLEHIERPAEVFEVARSIVRADGRVIISVPNGDRLILDRSILPLDWPPHHLTRWTTSSLESLARGSGFQLESMFFEPTNAAYRRLGRLPGALATPVAAALALMRGGSVNMTSLRPGRWLSSGHSIVGAFRLC